MMALPSKEEALLWDKYDNAKTDEEKKEILSEIREYLNKHPEQDIY